MNAEDATWDAVVAARAAGWTVTQFISVAQRAWSGSLREEACRVDDEFKRRWIGK